MRKDPGIRSKQPHEASGPAPRSPVGEASVRRPRSGSNLDALRRRRISGTSPSGRPLDATTRAAVERSLGRRLPDVRIHDDERAHSEATARRARAYTEDRDVTFGPGQFDPHSKTGLRLLGHELTHVLQQAAAPPGRAATRAHEAEAEAGGAAVASGRTHDGPISPARRSIQRQETEAGPAPPPTATWYQRAAGFSSALEMLANVLTTIRSRVAQEQADWYVFSDRELTRPVVDRILAQARAFRDRAVEFVSAAPPDEPLLDQLRQDLALFEMQLRNLEAERPADIGGVEATARRFTGGVMGAGGAFLGFLRLGLWDSWAQFLSDGSARRIEEAQEGMMQLMLDIDQQGLASTVGTGTENWVARLEEAERSQQYIASSSQFGATAFDIYFAGRGLVSGAQGVSQMSRAAGAFRALGNPAPWRSAIRLGVREMTTFRGVGVYGPGVQRMLPPFQGRSFLGSTYGLPQAGPTVPVLRIIRSQEDLVAKAFREPNSVLVDSNGQFRPLGDIARGHMRSSSGSPLQSGYPVADVETVVAANPQNLGVARAPYYVVIEVPQGQTLVGANELVAARAGLSTGDFAEFQINRFGLRLPEEFRPPPGGTLSPEAQAWVETNFGFGPQSRVAIDALDGIPYYEWEQMVLAPDLRPYVTSVQPNPLWAESAGPLGLRPGRPPIFDPATNPQTLFGLGQAPGGWPRVMTYLDWMRAQSAAGTLPYTTTELAGVERVTMLGGRPLYVPVGAPLVPDLLAEPPIEDRDISPAQAEGYLSWLRQTTGAPEALTGGSQGSAASAADASALLGHAAAELREAGGRIVGLRISPGVGYIEARVDTPDAADAVASSLVSIGARIPPDFDLGIKLVVENASVDFAGRYDSLELSPRVRLVIQNAAGFPLYFR